MNNLEKINLGTGLTDGSGDDAYVGGGKINKLIEVVNQMIPVWRSGELLEQINAPFYRVFNGVLYVFVGVLPDTTSDSEKPVVSNKWREVGFFDELNVANNLTISEEGKVLDARQGKVLDDKKLDKYLTIGGENLLKNTKNFKNLNGWYPYTSCVGVLTGDFIKINASSVGSPRYRSSTYIKLSEFEENYTVRIVYKSEAYLSGLGGKYGATESSGEQGYVVFNNIKNSDLGAGYRESIFSWEAPAYSSSTPSFWIYILLNVNQEVFLKEIKLERGSVNSGWSPSIEELKDVKIYDDNGDLKKSGSDIHFGGAFSFDSDGKINVGMPVGFYEEGVIDSSVKSLSNNLYCTHVGSSYVRFGNLVVHKVATVISTGIGFQNFLHFINLKFPVIKSLGGSVSKFKGSTLTREQVSNLSCYAVQGTAPITPSVSFKYKNGDALGSVSFNSGSGCIEVSVIYLTNIYTPSN